MSHRKDRINRAFGEASEGYAHAAKLQRVTATELAGRIGELSRPFSPRILEIGCGTGFLTKALRETFGDARWTVTDISADMLAACRHELGDPADVQFLQMDGEVPTVEGPFDLICANMTFQWFENLPGSIARLVSLLSSGGCLAYTTLAKGSLAEWQDAHRACGFVQGTPEFPTAEALNEYWPVGVGDGTVDIVDILRTYPSALAFVHVIKGIGAEIPVVNHQPLSAGAMRSVFRHLDQGGEVKMTYQVAYASYQKLA